VHNFITLKERYLATKRIDLLISLEYEFPQKWAQYLTDNPRFVPIDHDGQAPEHTQGGYDSLAYYKSVNP